MLRGFAQPVVAVVWDLRPPCVVDPCGAGVDVAALWFSWMCDELGIGLTAQLFYASGVSGSMFVYCCWDISSSICSSVAETCVIQRTPLPWENERGMFGKPSYQPLQMSSLLKEKKNHAMQGRQISYCTRVVKPRRRRPSPPRARS